MEYRYLEESLKSYIEKLSAKLPCPGGGSAAIVSVALANALISMVCNFSVESKKINEDSRKTSREILNKAIKIQEEVNKFIELDSILYEKIQQTMKDAKNFPEKHQDYQNALKESVEMHMNILEYCNIMVEWNDKLIENCNPYLISDIGVSASLIEGALRAARINVLVNLDSIRDSDYVSTTLEKLKQRSETLIVRAIETIYKVEKMMLKNKS